MQKGFAPIIVILILTGVVAFVLLNIKKISGRQSGNAEDMEVSWRYDNVNKAWNVEGSPPKCPDPLSISSPVDVSLASGILYPGQMRTAGYKPHGGFRFDDRQTGDVEVRAVMDMRLVKASKYLEDGSPQYLTFFINDCGMMVMHDHFFKLSPKLEEALKNLPTGAEGDSRTTEITPRVLFEKGAVLATEVGHGNGQNIFVDFGLYDLRKTNGVVFSPSFGAKNSNVDEYGTHALCWFDYIPEKDESLVRGLPAGGHEGKESNLCL